MGSWIADRLHDERGKISGSVLVLGLTFKENVPDLRNSRVIDVIKRLIALGHQVAVTDPVADPEETRRPFGLTMATPEGRRYAVSRHGRGGPDRPGGRGRNDCGHQGHVA